MAMTMAPLAIFSNSGLPESLKKISVPMAATAMMATITAPTMILVLPPLAHRFLILVRISPVLPRRASCCCVVRPPA